MPRAFLVIGGVVIGILLLIAIIVFRSYRSNLGSSANFVENAYVNTQQLNLRSGPGTEYSVVTKLSQGDSVICLERAQSRDGTTWVRIRAGSFEGWVNQKLLSNDAALKRGQEPSANLPLAPIPSINIKQTDFRNFTYPLSSEHAEMFKRKTVQIHNGKYDNGKSGTDWQAFSVNEVIYGDLTGDGQEEAVILAITEWVGANPAGSIDREFYIYTMSNGQASLLMMPDDLRYWRDYAPFENTNDNCDGFIWDIRAKDIHQLLLTLELEIGGRHCVDKGYSVTMNYRWNGERLVLAANPTKREKKGP